MRIFARDADLTGVNFNGAVLTGADFRWALYDAADLAGCARPGSTP